MPSHKPLKPRPPSKNEAALLLFLFVRPDPRVGDFDNDDMDLLGAYRRLQRLEMMHEDPRDWKLDRGYAIRFTERGTWWAMHLIVKPQYKHFLEMMPAKVA